MVLAFLKTNDSTLIIICSIVALIAAIVVICFFVLRKKMIYKKVKNTEYKLNSDKKNLIENYLKRIHTFSTNNDDYIEVYDQLHNQFINLFDVETLKLKERLNGLLIKIKNEKLTKNLRKHIQTYEMDLNKLHEEIASLYTHCEQILKTGEGLRNRALMLKTYHRQIDSDLTTYHPNLSICYSTLKDYLKDIEIEFEMFEKSMNGAAFKEASLRLDSIESKITKLYGKISTIAEYNNVIEKILPEKIDELENKNKQLVEDGMFVNHIKVIELCSVIRDVLNDIKKDFQKMSFKNFVNQANEIEEKLLEASNALDEEVASKLSFDNHYHEILEKVKFLESEFIKTKRQFASANDYYLIDQDNQQKFTQFVKNSTLLSDQKREFESFLFVNNRNPYSFLIRKMNEMENNALKVEADIEYFARYFANLKKYVEDTFANITNSNKKLIIALGTLRKNKLKAIYDKYRIFVDEYLTELKNVIVLLYDKPINVLLVRKLYDGLSSKIEDLCSKMYNDVDNAILAEKAIVFANQYRSEFSEIEKAMLEIDEMYLNLNYSETAQAVIKILEKYHPIAYNKFRS